jgi:hypothetical protein
VTLLYVATGLVAVFGRFSIPYLVRLIRRRFVFTLGTLSLVISSILFAFDEVPALAGGLILSTFAFACIEITSQLYLLDHVPRHATVLPHGFRWRFDFGILARARAVQPIPRSPGCGDA